jgi:glycosyltransferase involved in cell wall biosynthesis
VVEICAIIPAFNEEDSIARVLAEIPRGIFSEIVVIDNNSSDSTSHVAAEAGATVIFEERHGYGSACLKGIDYLAKRTPHPGIVVFLDADHADHPAECPLLIQPIIENSIDFVLGSRVKGKRQNGAMKWYQLAGNSVITWLIWLFYGVHYTDLGPFRAIKFDSLLNLQMTSRTYGWTAEMQVKAASQRLRYLEVPVSYRPRIGKSKISGTVRGSVTAAGNILHVILGNLRW